MGKRWTGHYAWPGLKGVCIVNVWICGSRFLLTHRLSVASAKYCCAMQIWRLPDLVLVTTLRGHKRGVWAAQFSPVDQAVATASGVQCLLCNTRLHFQLAASQALLQLGVSLALVLYRSCSDPLHFLRFSTLQCMI